MDSSADCGNRMDGGRKILESSLESGAQSDSTGSRFEMLDTVSHSPHLFTRSSSLV